MENTNQQPLAVSDFIALTNQILEYSFSSVVVEGEVSGFKVNQNKYVFFDLKDDGGSLGCFMTVWQLRQPIEDGMKVVVTATPKLTDWGKFSLTIREVRPSGEGSLKRSYDLLKSKLEKEGLFDPARKRPLPFMPSSIAVISSTQAAGYADFIKILNDRWCGANVEVAHVQVQGKEAPDQIIKALRHFNAKEHLPEVIVVIRGGGSLDDLSAFNDEMLVREIARSRVPTLVGIGHETDTTLVDLTADVRAATPSNAAQLVAPDKYELAKEVRYRTIDAAERINQQIDWYYRHLRARLEASLNSISRQQQDYSDRLEYRKQVLSELDPKRVLERGYAIISGRLKTGQTIEIETRANMATAEVIYVKNKS